MRTKLIRCKKELFQLCLKRFDGGCATNIVTQRIKKFWALIVDSKLSSFGSTKIRLELRKL